MTNQTDFDQFPVSMHHLVRHATRDKEMKLYSVGRIARSFYTEIKENQVKESPYEITDIEVGERFGFRVHYTGYENKRWENREIVCRIDFKNKQTRETEEFYLIDEEWADLLTGLEDKLGVNVSNNVQENLQVFNGTEVTGVTMGFYSKNRTKYDQLFGVFI